MGIKRPFTLFLCVLLFLYLIFAPKYLLSIDREKLIKGKSKEDVPWQGVITLWDIPRPTIAGSSFGWIKGRISAFEKEYPGVFIDLRELHYDNNDEIIEKAAMEGKGVDILPLYVNNKPIPLENIEPLDGWINEDVKEVIREELIQGVTYGERIYGMPFSISGNVMVINKDLLESIGCKTPQNREWNYEEFMEFLKAIKNAKGQEDMIIFDAYLGEGGGGLMPILLSDGGQIFQREQQQFGFYQPEMVSGLQKIQNIKIKGNTHENFGMRDKQEVYEDFLENQKTAVLAGDSNIIYVLERLEKQGQGFSYKIMPYPMGSMEVPIWYSHGISAYGMIKGDNREKQEMIKRFLEFLVQEESQQSLKAMGAFPVNKKVRDLYEETPLIEEWFKIGYEYQTYPLHPHWGQMEQKIMESIQGVLKGEKSPTESFKSLQVQLEREQ